MKNTISRRHFLKSAAISAAGLAVFPQQAWSEKLKTNKSIRMGFIGLGRQSMYLLSGFIAIPGVKVVAGCDVYEIKRERFAKRVNDFYGKQSAADGKTAEGKTGGDVKLKMYENYKELLANPDIDAVVIAVPDHWHAFIAIEACKAKKDIYLEKPLTFTIHEGQKLVKAVRSNGVILAVGSQQRSDYNFQHAVKMVQEGKIGKVQRVNACVGAPPKPYDLPQETVPAGLNWPLWLGPSQYLHYNHELNPPISLNPEENETIWAGWRWYTEIGGGFTTDWGAHMFDIAQWGLGMDKSGPIEIIPAGYNNTQFLTFKYESGAVMTEEPFNEKNTKGVKFWGEKGWIEVSREHFLASDDSLLPPKVEKTEGAYETKIPHQLNFVEAVQKHIDPIVPVEIGHRTCTVCTLGNLAYGLKRPLKWDPKAERFVNDPEADALLTKQYSAGYSI